MKKLAPLALFVCAFIFLSACKVETNVRKVEAPQTASGLILHEFTIPLDSESRRVDSKEVDVHFIVDDSESLAEVLDTKVKEALANLSSTLKDVKSANIYFYRLSDIDTKKKITEEVNGNTTTTTEEFLMPDPISSIQTNDQLGEDKIKAEIRKAISEIEFKEFFAEEKGLCFLMRAFQSGLEKENNEKSQIVSLITNENDWRFNNDDSTNRCIWKRSITRRPFTTTKSAEVNLRLFKIRVDGEFRDNMNEKHDFGKSYFPKDNTVLSFQKFDQLSSQGRTCSNEEKAYIESLEGITLDKCDIKTTTGGKYYRSSAKPLLEYLELVDDKTCESTNFTIDGLSYSSVPHYLEQNHQLDPRLIKSCRFSPSYTYESSTFNETLTYYSELSGTTNLAEGIVRVIDSYEPETKKLVSMLSVYYNENDNQCDDDEKEYTRHGFAYEKLDDYLKSYEVTSYQGDVCLKSYNELFKNSIGKEINKSFKLKYIIRELPESFIQRTFTPILVNKNGSALKIPTNLYELKKEDNDFYIYINEELKAELGNYEKLVILVESPI